jgi:hypothetical protein
MRRKVVYGSLAGFYGIPSGVHQCSLHLQALRRICSQVCHLDGNEITALHGNYFLLLYYHIHRSFIPGHPLEDKECNQAKNGYSAYTGDCPLPGRSSFADYFFGLAVLLRPAALRAVPLLLLPGSDWLVRSRWCCFSKLCLLGLTVLAGLPLRL